MTAPADVAQSPAAQGSIVPRGWKPSPSEPIPVVRCSHTYKDGDKHGRDGERCNRWSLRGYHKCWTHSGRGNLDNVNQFKQNIVEANYIRLYGTLDEATDWLIDLAENATSEAVRLKAINDIHAMCGMRPGADVNVTITTNQDPAETLRERLKTLQSRTTGAIEAEPGSIEDVPSASDGVTVSSTVNFDTEEQT